MYTWFLVAAIASPSGISDELKVDSGYEAALVVPATGAQIYECAEKDGKFGWQFKGPEATLYDDKRSGVIGKHYGGPTWEASDGSKIKGALKARQDAPAGNIPWLLLTTTTEGAGRFAGVAFIQRVNTSGGIAPKSSCDKAMSGKVERVDYKADYYLYRKK
jgi:hypothetical protein